ncbi:YjjG family noncanonical pyrimidine nucleotidase [Clostridium sp. E02]|uniref:YjjG family noncanonical pyrimidine nucleotidase n=1 Tax=Clostridium sp. E02 TaxID=2487134 RepID=UPI000F52C23C|nr:YjjG family noncanonical pyrimidine nucleotidase [Clostridium sp. E02]
MYQTYLLDLDNTILDFNAAEIRGFQKVIEFYEIKYIPGLLEQYKKINRNLWNQLEQGTIHREELFFTRFKLFFEELGKEIDGKEAELFYREQLSNSPDLMPHAKEALTQLKQQGKKLYSASNGVYSTQVQRLKQAGIYQLFDGMFISEAIGSEKPDVNFFEHCFTHIIDFKKEETLMVGDSLTSDIQGAIHAGIDSCYFNHFHNSTYADSSVSKATYNIKELPELLHL